MKVKPVMDALEARGADVVLVHTGQHYDEAMNEVFFRDLGIRRPDRHLGTGSGTHAEQTARVMVAFEPVLDEVAPDAVVVVGDVTSTLACGLVAARAGTLLAHVEAACAAATGPCQRKSTGQWPTGSLTISWHRPPTPWTTCAPRATAKTRST